MILDDQQSDDGKAGCNTSGRHEHVPAMALGAINSSRSPGRDQCGIEFS